MNRIFHVLAWLLVAAAFIGITLLMITASRAQAPASPTVEGRWTGTLGAAPNQLRLVVSVVRAADGLILGTLTSLDQGNAVIPIDTFAQTGTIVKFTTKSVNGSFEGMLSADGSRLTGTWSQGVPLPLEFIRSAATPQPLAPPPVDAALGPAQAVLNVPLAPTPVHGDGKNYLAFELYINNAGAAPLQLSRLDILSGNVPIASYTGADLNALLQQLPAGTGTLDQRALAPHVRAVAFLGITLDAGKPVPKALRLRLTSLTGQSFETADVTLPAAKPVRIGPPLNGDNWLASGGPGSAISHRQAVMFFDGKAYIAQRFAIDWIQLNPDGTSFKGDPKDNGSYRAYGAEALAVADATVSETKDGIPENIPGPTSRAVPITLETIGGNHVILDLGQGRFAFYAHLQPGSLRVKVGDKVKRGQVLGLVGNSGNSTQPHLHFHVVNGNSPLAADGLPYVIDAFEVQAKAGDPWKVRRNEIPMNNARVRFQPRQ